MQVLIAIGANLPRSLGAGVMGASPLATCEAAVQALREIPGLSVERVSAWYESEAIPASSQPPYVNGVAFGRSFLSPETLLERLHAIEADYGRVRGELNAARTLDLDLIDAGGEVRRDGSPVLPHPRAHERAFVLLPLRDVEPDWKHPILGATVQELIDRLEPQAIRRLPADVVALP
ncbi:2-amino-4-hydroxy-6-hydroxymethyldihydropteridine diphosphokinase [Acetobacter sp. DsW_063]|uniref:2-amino-4-hydroxy-6- hydroxymethyldihydropteridine diphosphokinase n=1 Tax=Acetobacter sp. DsW_063 TaxID=1514894 RepID=UPI000A3B0068|nr:2-amino-4-hydroxy-6-hydroxymethyldihydropteridine diphosphokinase [Acetobacter sp. DsW_063]